MIKLINIITQNIILLGCCAISIFILFVLITFIKNVDDFAAITNMYDYIRMQIILKVKIMKTRKHFIRKYELLVRCIQTNLEFFIA